MEESGSPEKGVSGQLAAEQESRLDEENMIQMLRKGSFQYLTGDSGSRRTEVAHVSQSQWTQFNAFDDTLFQSFRNVLSESKKSSNQV